MKINNKFHLKGLDYKFEGLFGNLMLLIITNRDVLPVLQEFE